MSGIRLSEKHGVNPMLVNCFWCGEAMGVATLGKLKDDAEAPSHAVINYDPCDTCAENFKQGIVIICVTDQPTIPGQPAVTAKNGVVSYPTGTHAVVTVASVRRIFLPGKAEEIISAGKILVDKEIYYKLMGPATTGEGEGTDE